MISLYDLSILTDFDIIIKSLISISKLDMIFVGDLFIFKKFVFHGYTKQLFRLATQRMSYIYIVISKFNLKLTYL